MSELDWCLIKTYALHPSKWRKQLKPEEGWGLLKVTGECG